MKFANLILDSNKGMENIGDWVQIFAIERLYQYMNVNYKEVIRIKISEISSYNGEYVILPINYPFYGYYNLSPKIIPVFLGISILHNSAAEGLKMRNFQPVGCRDYHTWKELTKVKIEAYISGCLTITFPKRTISPKLKKIFIVDVSDKIYEKIPYEIKNSAKRLTHIYYEKEGLGEERAREQYKLYEKEANLVITSRIHCAQPCLAMGIPVVFICEICSFRYDVLRPYIPVYMLDKIDEVNWHPAILDLEEEKKLMLRNAANRVIDVWKKYEDICSISDYYNRTKFIEGKLDSVWAFQKYILNRWKKKDIFLYSLWGITQAAESIYEWIEKEYPNAILDMVIDAKRTDSFHGIKPKTIDKIENCKSVIFVTAGSANPVAIDIFKKYNIKNYVICYNGKYIVNGEENTY